MLADQPYTCSVDWWSFGVLLFKMMTGLLPFKTDNSAKQMLENIITHTVCYPEHLTNEAKDLLKKVCLTFTHTRIVL